MASIKAKTDVLWSTPIQSRHDSGYWGHEVFGYNIEASPIRKKTSDRDIITGNNDCKSESGYEAKKVTKKLNFIPLLTLDKTVSSSTTSDSGIASMSQAGDNGLASLNQADDSGIASLSQAGDSGIASLSHACDSGIASLSQAGDSGIASLSQAGDSGISSFLNLKSFSTESHSNILQRVNNQNSKVQQPYKYICKELFKYQDRPATLGDHIAQLADKNYNRIKNISFIKRNISTIDFLFELNLRNCTSIISQILSYLPDEDLRKASYVCKEWQNIIFKDNKANERRSGYINNRKNVMKGPNKENKEQTRCQTEKSHKTAFHNVVNALNEVPKQPLYDDILGKFDSFRKEVKTLQDNEQLRKCPKCNYPSKSKSGDKYCCTRNLCLHEFCKKCLGPYIDNHICSGPGLDTFLPSIIIGSKKSKRNLRRL